MTPRPVRESKVVTHPHTLRSVIRNAICFPPSTSTGAFAVKLVAPLSGVFNRADALSDTNGLDTLVPV
jgi:hypothetical protein